jgi:hypothetical protein
MEIEPSGPLNTFTASSLALASFSRLNTGTVQHYAPGLLSSRTRCCLDPDATDPPRQRSPHADPQTPRNVIFVDGESLARRAGAFDDKLVVPASHVVALVRCCPNQATV